MIQKTKKYSVAALAGILLFVTVSFQSDFFEVAKQIDIYTTLFKELNMHYIDEVNPAELTENAISNMLENLDPYTVYYNEQGIEDARMEATGDFGSVGIETRFSNGALEIKEIFKDGPAQKAGLLAGDKIVKINDVNLINFEEKSAQSILNGVPNSNVHLEIMRGNKILKFDLLRKKIEVNPVPYYTLLSKDVGYISFITFNKKASEEVKAAFQDLKNQGMKKLIIDVRNNGGGLLGEAIKIVNFFIPKNKTVVTTKGKIEKFNETLVTTGDPIDTQIPIVILVNGQSASASEILAGALQDYDRAVIMGERSFGKGLVQRFVPLTYGTQLKMTISKYYTPSGRCIQELNYTNRDKKGNIPKFSDEEITKHKTQNGRIVFGGGGIMPDIISSNGEINPVTKKFLQSDAFFKYVTFYLNTANMPSKSTDLKLPQSQFNQVLEFVKNNASDFETETEIALKGSVEIAKTEKISTNTTITYSNYFQSIQEEKIKELSKNKDQILTELTEEICKRHYYIDGLYEHKSVFDNSIKQAIKVLQNEQNYQSVLKN